MDAETFINGNAGDAWNERFQYAVSLREGTVKEKRLKYSLLNSVNKDFIAVATLYAKVIISEYFLPHEKKSIKCTLQLGGDAGGKKFLWRDILFKLADGSKGPYEKCDEWAAKAMGHELKGVNSYFRCAIPGLHMALQAVIDYKGFRMNAQAVLPICGQSTLVTGFSSSRLASSVAPLRSCIAEDSNIDLTEDPAQDPVESTNKKLKFAASELNLREHRVHDTVLYSACDIEGHVGHDKRTYIVDLARTFPPESPQHAPHLTQTTHFRVGQKVVFPRYETLSGVDCANSDIDMEKDYVQGWICKAAYDTTPRSYDIFCRFTPLAKDSTSGHDASSHSHIGYVVHDVQENSIKLGHQCIFWRLLRPEFVKHRGRQLIHDWEGRKVDRQRAALSNQQPVHGVGSQPFLLNKLARTVSSVPLESTEECHELDIDIDIPITPTTPVMTSKPTSETDLRDIDKSRHSTCSSVSRTLLANQSDINGLDVADEEDRYETDERLNFVAVSEEDSPESKANDILVSVESTDGPSIVRTMTDAGPAGQSEEDTSDTDLLTPPVLLRATSLPESIPKGLIFPPPIATASTGSAPIKSYLDTLTSAAASEGAPSLSPKSQLLAPILIPSFKPGSSMLTRSISNPLPESTSNPSTPMSSSNNGITVLDLEATVAANKRNNTVVDELAFDFDLVSEHYYHDMPLAAFTLPDPTVVPPLHSAVNTRHSPLSKIRDYSDNSYVSGRSLSHSSGMLPPPYPLSPDGLSGFGINDPECDKITNDIHAATNVLVRELIPAMADELMTYGDPNKRFGLSLTEYMHQNGVNIRHMGLLRSLIDMHPTFGVSSPNDFDALNPIPASDIHDIRQSLLIECVGRTLKNILRTVQRSWMKSQSNTGTELGLKKCIVTFLNLVTGVSDGHASKYPLSKAVYEILGKTSEYFWKKVVSPGLVVRFGRIALDSDEYDDVEKDLDDPENVLTEIDEVEEFTAGTNHGIQCGKLFSSCEPYLKMMLQKLCLSTGIVLSEECKAMLLSINNAAGFEFVISDIQEVAHVVNHMHQVDLGEGMVMSAKAQLRQSDNTKCHTQTSKDIILRYSKLAIKLLKKALEAIPDDLKTRFALFDTYQMMASGNVDKLESDKFFKQCRDFSVDTRCAYTKTSYREDILGIVLHVKHRIKRTYTQPGAPKPTQLPTLEIGGVTVDPHCVSLQYYLNEEAHHSAPGTGTRRDDVRFLPLIIDEEHASRGLPLLMEEICRMDCLGTNTYKCPVCWESQVPVRYQSDLMLQKAAGVGEFTVEIGFRVISAIMNALICNFCLDNQAGISEAAITGYARMHHMLLYLSSQDPRWRKHANQVIDDFVHKPNKRFKQHTKDLGRLLIYLLLADCGWSQDIAKAYLEESLSRQVYWFLKKENDAPGAPLSRSVSTVESVESSSTSISDPWGSNPNNYDRPDKHHPELVVLEADEVSPYRLVTTFRATTPALRLLMFQVCFLEQIARKTQAILPSLTRAQTMDPPGAIPRAASFDSGSVWTGKHTGNVLNANAPAVAGDGSTANGANTSDVENSLLASLSLEQQEKMLHIYNSSHGKPTAALREDLMEEYDAIQKVSSYFGFLQKIRLSYSPKAFTAMLREAVRQSVTKGYVTTLQLDQLDDEMSSASSLHRVASNSSMDSKSSSLIVEPATSSSDAVNTQHFDGLSIVNPDALKEVVAVPAFPIASPVPSLSNTAAALSSNTRIRSFSSSPALSTGSGTAVHPSGCMTSTHASQNKWPGSWNTSLESKNELAWTNAIEQYDIESKNGMYESIVPNLLVRVAAATKEPTPHHAPRTARQPYSRGGYRSDSARNQDARNQDTSVDRAGVSEYPSSERGSGGRGRGQRGGRGRDRGYNNPDYRGGHNASSTTSTANTRASPNGGNWTRNFLGQSSST